MTPAPNVEAERQETRAEPADGKTNSRAGSRASSRAEAHDPAPLCPAPLCEDFFEDLPSSAALLHPDKPLVPLSSFAIIVQADCCTPSTPDSEGPLVPPLAPDGFRIDASSVAQIGWGVEGYSALPKINDVEAFGEPWLLFPETGSLELETDFEATGDLEPLEYEAVPEALRSSAMGQRDSIVPRPRKRYPYAASEVASALNFVPRLSGLLNVMSSDDWEAIEPVRREARQLLLPETPQVEPYTKVPLSIAALLNMTLATAPATGSREGATDSLAVLARALDQSAGLHTECASSPMVMTPIFPGVGSRRPVLRSWQRNGGEERVPPLQFPSLFQLGPVLPPRPEVMGR